MREAGAMGVSDRIQIVPGLAGQVDGEAGAAALRARGWRTELLQPVCWPGVPARLDEYGRRLGDRIESNGEPIRALIGLSVGTQAAAVAATRTRQISQLILVSPTFPPALRRGSVLIRTWMLHNRGGNEPSLKEQLPGWVRAGPARMLTGFRSSLRVALEDVLPEATASLTVVHAEHDPLSSPAYAEELARRFHGRLHAVPGASHSWPFGDPDAFVELVEALLRDIG